MPLPDGTITLGDVIDAQLPGSFYRIETTRDEASDYASLYWDPANAGPVPTLASLQAGKAATQAALDLQAKARRVGAALQAQQDQIAQALGILADGLDQLNRALAPNAFTGNSRPTIAKLAALRTKLADVLATS